MTRASLAPPSSPAGRGGTSDLVGRLGPRELMLTAAWCGLAAGWLEVGTWALGRRIHPDRWLSLMGRHSVWTIPLSNLLLFSLAGQLFGWAARRFPAAGAWLVARALLAAAIMPPLLIAAPGVYRWAWCLLAAGVAVRMTPALERQAERWRRWRSWTLPALLGAVPMAAALILAGDAYKQHRESRRPIPSGDPPDVLLIVLDTVRADHLNLYGYPRDTSRALNWLARRGITFLEARAAAPWTLASHATFFTGRWPHELDVKWMTPLTKDVPTLAAYLGSRGYATAGFVGNIIYCSYETGLDRGFTRYDDYPADLGHLRPLRSAVLFDTACSAAAGAIRLVAEGVAPEAWRRRIEAPVEYLRGSHRKDAHEVNSEFLAWLAGRPEPRRPYFAFLNYFDAHVPYLLPEGAPLRFGPGPRTPAEFRLLFERWKVIDKRRLPPRFRDLIRDSYDNCLGHLDDALGALVVALERAGRLDRTVIIVAADHGEELGDHGLFEHGESLYRPEIRVPLVVVLPSRRSSPAVVRDVVSLRDLPATIVDVLGLSAEAPFPGRSMAALWAGPPDRGEPAAAPASPAVSELDSPNPANPSRGLSPAVRGPLRSIAAGDHVYIRNDGDGAEELYDERRDPAELSDLAREGPLRPILETLRAALDRARPRTPPGAPRGLPASAGRS